tara:strand:+ start:949 stop:1788 length:840 start_codon:yes stop_codon:yes gene_type:complete
MTEQVEQVQEPVANPYNKEKSWHTPDAPSKGSADTLFYAEEEQATPDEAPVETPKKTRTNYKKRYDDLKKHYDEKVANFKQKEQELQAAAGTNIPQVQLKSAEDLEKFKTQYPDLFETVETVAHLKSEEQTKELQAKLTVLQKREATIVRKEAEESLRDKHPDFEDIKKDDNFHAWADTQPEAIQAWIYNNPDNVNLAIKAIDLYKLEAGVNTQAPKRSKSKSQSTGSAADMVSTKTTRIDSKEPKIWSRKEIAGLSMRDYDKYEQVIDIAHAEGRIIS